MMSASKKVQARRHRPATARPVAFLGSFAADGKTLILRPASATTRRGQGTARLSGSTSNKIRYTLQLDRQEPGAPQYKGVISVGLTKDGEAFAAGAWWRRPAQMHHDRRRGGDHRFLSWASRTPSAAPAAATSSTKIPRSTPSSPTSRPKSKPANDKTAAKEKPASKGKDDGSFDGLIDEPSAKKRRDDHAAKASASKTKAATAEEPAAEARNRPRPRTTPKTKAKRESSSSARISRKDGKTKPSPSTTTGRS